MPSILSKMFTNEWNVPYNCYEMGHGWTPYCSEAALEISLLVFLKSLKLYTPLYLGQAVIQSFLQGSKPNKVNKYEMAQELFKNVVRSSLFLGSNAFFVITFVCFCLGICGRFYYPWNAYIPSLLGSFLALSIEHPKRRKTLAFYVMNIASEIGYKICLSRDYIRPIPYANQALFTVSVTLLLYLYSSRKLYDRLLSFSIRTLISDQSRSKRSSRESEKSAKSADDNHQADQNDHGDIGPSDRNRSATKWPLPKRQWIIFQYFTDRWRRLKLRIPLLSLTNANCDHRHPQLSCAEQIIFRNFLRTFTATWAAKFLLRFFSRLLRQSRHSNLRELFRIAEIFSYQKYLQTSLFLATFTSIYNLTLCTTNHLNHLDQNNQLPQHRQMVIPPSVLGSVIASLVTTTAIAAPNQSVTLYLLWKSMEMLFNVGVKAGWIRYEQPIVLALYAMACSQIFYAAILEPEKMKRSYKKFVDQISNNRLRYINRNVLEVFGTNATQGYELFLPKYDLRYTTRQFQESVLIWLL